MSPGCLTELEFQLGKLHREGGSRVLTPISFSTGLALVLLCIKTSEAN